MKGAKLDLSNGPDQQLLKESPGESLSPSHVRRLRNIHRSAGWPCCDPVEVELVAAGWLERQRSPFSHETVRLTERAVAFVTAAAASTASDPSKTVYEALVHQVAREMTRNGRLAWCNLPLRMELPVANATGLAQARSCLAKPDVFSIRNTSVEAYAQPITHVVIVDRADLMEQLDDPDHELVYHEVGGECWYVLDNGTTGAPVVELSEIPQGCGVLVREGSRLVVARSALHRARPRLPFAVWLALAKTQPVRGADEGAQGLLGDTER